MGLIVSQWNCVCVCVMSSFRWSQHKITSPLQHQLLLDTERKTPTVCLSDTTTTSTQHHDNPSPWTLTCGVLRDDRRPGQFGSGEQDVVTLLAQFEDPVQHNALTDTDTQ